MENIGVHDRRLQESIDKRSAAVMQLEADHRALKVACCTAYKLLQSLNGHNLPVHGSAISEAVGELAAAMQKARCMPEKW